MALRIHAPVELARPSGYKEAKKKAENNPKVLTQKKVHFMRSIFPKCKVRANFAFLSK